MGNVCNGADDCRRATREQIGAGAEVIKFAATGGVLSNIPGGLAQQMMDDEMRAVVETARKFGRKVAVHAHGVDGINAALRAGVDSVEHGTFTNAETFRLYRQTGAYYVPTLLAPAAALADGQRGALTRRAIRKSSRCGGQCGEELRPGNPLGRQDRLRNRHGRQPHGRNAEEFALMVRNGMAPADAIRSATVNAGDLLGKLDTIGTIAPGKDADIIAVDGDPLANVRELESVDFVMKWGRVHKAGGQRQLTEVD
jgi:imidazolonepropionase-like amidohydrolase